MSQLQPKEKDFIKIGKRDENSTNHWTDGKDSPLAEAVLSGKKVILCLPGDMTLQPRNANHMARNIQNLLTEENRDKVDIYAAYYDSLEDGQKFRISLSAEYGELSLLLKEQNRDLTSQPLYENFFMENILPLISKNGGTERLSCEEASQNLRNLILFTHCHGSMVALDLENRLLRSMEHLGYSKEERERAAGRLLIINANSRMPMNRTKSTVIHMISQADTNNNAANTTITSLHVFACSEKIKNLYTLANLRLSQKEYLLLFPQVADPDAVWKGVFGVQKDDVEHCGIFFNKQSAPFKTFPGNWGCNAVYDILNRAVESNEEPQDIVNTVFQQKSILREALSVGDAFLKKYKEEYLKGLDEKISSLKQDPVQISAADFPAELLLIKQNGQNILDKILQDGNLKDLDAAAKILDGKSDALANENILSPLVEQGRYEDARQLQKKRRFRTRKANASEIPALFQIPVKDVPAALPFITSCVFDKDKKQDAALLLQLKTKAQRISNRPLREDSCKKIQEFIQKTGIILPERQETTEKQQFPFSEEQKKRAAFSLLKAAFLKKQTRL